MATEVAMADLTVEFLGIPRERAGCDRINVAADDVGELLHVLAGQLTEFANSCLVDGNLRSEYLICVNGKTFTRDGAHAFAEGDDVLILSADVGG